MTTDHSKTHYYKATTLKKANSATNDRYGWVVYHYDSTGNRQITVKRSDSGYLSEPEALDAAVEWCEENNIEAELDAS